MQLGFRVPDGTAEKISDFVVLVSLDVVKDENDLVTGRQLLDCAFKLHTVKGDFEPIIRESDFETGSARPVTTLSRRLVMP